MGFRFMLLTFAYDQDDRGHAQLRRRLMTWGQRREQCNGKRECPTRSATAPASRALMTQRPGSCSPARDRMVPRVQRSYLEANTFTNTIRLWMFVAVGPE